MAKGWTVLQTVNSNNYIPNSNAEKIRNNKKFNTMIKKAENAILKDPEQDIKRIKKEGEDLYLAKVGREDQLIEAYKEKRLKSKAIIKEAKRIIKERAEAEKKKKEKEAAAAKENESNVKAEA